MEKLIQEYLILSGKIVTVSYLLLLLTGFWRWEYFNKPLRIFFWYVVVTFILNFLEQLFIWGTRRSTHYYDLKPYLDYWQITNTVFMYILFYTKNALLLGWMYTLLFTTPSKGQLIWWIALGLTIFEWISYFSIDGYQGYGNVNPTLDGIFCFTVPMVYLGFLYQHTSVTLPLTKNSFFWISLGLIMENLIGLFFFYTAAKLQQSDTVTYSIVFMIKNVAVLTAIIFFCLAFYRANYIRFLRNEPAFQP